MPNTVRYIIKGIQSIIVFGGIGGKSPAKKKVQKPNIVFILADDVNYKDASAFNENSIISITVGRSGGDVYRFTLQQLFVPQEPIQHGI